MATAPVICTSIIDLWTTVVPLIFFKLVEIHSSDRVMQQFIFKQYISSNIDTSDQLYSISR